MGTQVNNEIVSRLSTEIWNEKETHNVRFRLIVELYNKQLNYSTRNIDKNGTKKWQS